MKAAAEGQGQAEAEAEVARLRALQEKESSRWLRVLPVDATARLTDLQWQTAVQLRLGMPRAPHGAAGPACEHERAASTDGWHSLVCVTRSGNAINARHHAVVRLLADAAGLLKVPARIEPYNLCDDNDSRPDIQLDLPEYSLLVDVTVSHPCAARWRAVAAARGVEAVGDARNAEKEGSYGPMAEALGVRFAPFVLYSYGGFHKSALSTIAQVASAYDPAVALLSLSAWKEQLKNRIAVCVQRCTANIVIEDAKRARAAGSARRRRHAGGSGARGRPRVRVRPRRRPAFVADRELRSEVTEDCGRAASLSAPLFASLSAQPPLELDSADEMVVESECEARFSLAAVPLAPPVFAPPTDAFVPGTPEMDVEFAQRTDADAAECEREMSVVCISRMCVGDSVACGAVAAAGAVGAAMPLVVGSVE